MPDSIYLKSCPLCGYLAALKMHELDNVITSVRDSTQKALTPGIQRSSSQSRKRKMYYFIVCTKCGFKSFHYPSSIEAITAWNRRPDPRNRRAFPRGPWKYYSLPNGQFEVAQTNARLELKKVLFQVTPDPSAHISDLSIEAIMRVITASQSMYENLYEAYNLLTNLLAQEGENLNQKDDESRILVTRLASLRADIELQLAGIDGASVAFDPNLDTPVLSRLGHDKGSLPTRGVRIAKIVQDDVPPPDFTIDNANLNADEGEEEEPDEEIEEGDEL